MREKASTPVLMSFIRSSGGLTSATALRQPLTSEGMWTRPEKFSVWGSPVHQKCSTMRRNGSVDSLPPLRGSASPRAATGASLPLTSERMWRRAEKFSLWGGLVHQKCSTILRDGSGDPRPAFVVGSSPVVTTVESLNGALVLSRRSSDCWDSPARTTSAT